MNVKWTDSSGPVTRLLSPILSLSPQGPDIFVRGKLLKMLKLNDDEVIICTRFGLYSVRTDSAQFLTFELVGTK